MELLRKTRKKNLTLVQQPLVKTVGLRSVGKKTDGRARLSPPLTPYNTGYLKGKDNDPL
jgi:hypothetical protein